MHALAGPMGSLMTPSALNHRICVDVIVPVPLHGRRQRSRGFNQSELLGRTIAQELSLPLDAALLRTTRRTPPQHGAPDRSKREENVAGSFRCTGFVDNKRVLLVDDVLTTGATARECARVLKAAGAASVWALAFCHTD
jgi:ComF family protein